MLLYRHHLEFLYHSIYLDFFFEYFHLVLYLYWIYFIILYFSCNSFARWTEYIVWKISPTKRSGILPASTSSNVNGNTIFRFYLHFFTNIFVNIIYYGSFMYKMFVLYLAGDSWNYTMHLFFLIHTHHLLIFCMCNQEFQASLDNVIFCFLFFIIVSSELINI